MKSQCSNHNSNDVSNTVDTSTCEVLSSNLNCLEDCIEAVNYLNGLKGSKFNPEGKIVKSLIEKLIGKGSNLSEIKEVIAYKVAEWKTVPLMRKYLRPEILFDLANFKMYRAEVMKTKNPRS